MECSVRVPKPSDDSTMIPRIQAGIRSTGRAFLVKVDWFRVCACFRKNVQPGSRSNRVSSQIDISPNNHSDRRKRRFPNRPHPRRNRAGGHLISGATPSRPPPRDGVIGPNGAGGIHHPVMTSSGEWAVQSKGHPPAQSAKTSQLEHLTEG